MDYVLAIRQSNFSKLWVSQILSQVAQNLLNFALIIRVFDLAQGTHFANLAVSLLVLSFGVPSIFFASLAGAYVDHWDRKKVMVLANLSRAVLVLCYLPARHNLVLILILSFLISSITQFFIPAEAATIPRLVPEKALAAANSLFIFSLYTSFIVGYSLSAPLIAHFGGRSPFYLDAVFFAIATVLALTLPAQKIAKNDSALSERPRLWSSFMENVRIVRSDRRLSYGITQLTITQAVLGVVLALAPALSVALLHQNLQRSSAVMIIPAGVGMVAGVLLITVINRKWSRIKVLANFLIVAGVALMLLGLTGQLGRTIHGHHIVAAPHVPFIVAALTLLLGLVNAVISATAQTLLHESSADEIRGKVFGALNMYINIAGTLPILFSGILADIFSVTSVITVIGLGIIIFGVFQVKYLAGRAAAAVLAANEARRQHEKGAL